MNRPRETPAPTLKFCIECGEKVASYSYSSVVYDDINDYGLTPQSFSHKEGVTTYRCDCSKVELIAPNMFNTGRLCPDCGHFMNLFAQYCGVCSRSLTG